MTILQSRLDTTRVFIDGYELDGIVGLKLEHNTYDAESMYGPIVQRHANVKATIELFDEGELSFLVEGKEMIGNELHFYGPLRRMFPSLFSSDLVEWQVEYLKTTKRPSLDRFKLKKDDQLFSSVSALAFRDGWIAGQSFVNRAPTTKTTTFKSNRSPLAQAFNKRGV